MVARLLLSTGRALTASTVIDEINISFVSHSFLEYSFRARKSFDREKVTMHWLRSVIGEGDIIYDIGANVGAYSLYAGLKLQSGRIYSFEPAFFNFASLCENIKRNKLEQKILPFPIAIGSESGATRMFLRSTESGSALHGIGRSESEGKAFSAEFIQGVGTMSVDTFCETPDIEFPNHIKIDVDGGEFDVIRGMAQVIEDDRLRSIVIEVNQKLWHDKIERLITCAGFRKSMTENLANGETVNQLFVR